MNLINKNKEPYNKSSLIKQESLNLTLISKFHEIDGLYKQSLHQYRQVLQEYNMEIKTLKNEILYNEGIVKDEAKNILLVESALLHDKNLLEKLHAKLFQKIDSLYTLQNEYKKLLDADKFEENVLRKEEDISELLVEIEELELSLLHKELERFNLVSILTPKEKALNELYLRMEHLEVKKSYFESSELTESKLLVGNEELIEDAELVVEEKKSSEN